VTRPPIRAYDTAENRVLAWAIARLRHEASLAGLGSSQVNSDSWQADTINALKTLDGAERLTWLRALTSTRPDAKDFDSIGRSRTHFYRHTVRECALLLRRYETPSVEDVTDLLLQRWFEPARDWQLFELAILIRLDETLRTTAARRRVRPLGWGGGAFARYDLISGAKVRLWYQTWPPSAAASEQRDAVAHYGISGSGSRPDIVVEFVKAGKSSAILLELKATESSDYLAQGLLQLLGYLRDRPALFGREGDAWLVAPAGGAFHSKPPDGRELWTVTDGDVGNAALAAIQALDSA